jgi:hypothetical protein
MIGDPNAALVPAASGSDSSCWYASSGRGEDTNCAMNDASWDISSGVLVVEPIGGTPAQLSSFAEVRLNNMKGSFVDV